MAIQMADAVDAAYARGIVHRDLKLVELLRREAASLIDANADDGH